MRRGATAALLLLALAGGEGAGEGGRARHDQDFEFDDRDREPRAARAPRYVYDPESPLCGGVSCARDELCALRAGGGGGALCLPRSQALSLSRSADTEEDSDDVFYDSDDDDDAALSYPGDSAALGDSGGAALSRDRNDIDDSDDADDAPPPEKPANNAQCVGCAEEAGSGGGGFVCGSDNRTYSSLCRLDLHNCLRGAAHPAHAAHSVHPTRRPSVSGPPGLPSPPRVTLQCPGEAGCGGAGGAARRRLADRLLDWFSVLQAGRPAPPRGLFPAGCRAEVRWMFARLDADHDALLQARELYALQHDDRERCLRPFLASCAAGGGEAGAGAGAGAGEGGVISRAAWCGCMRGAAPPCTALLRGAGGAVAWRPQCDKQGYFQPRQCSLRGRCWCSSRHGLRRACPAPAASPPSAAPPAAADDDEDGAGSGDAPLY